MIQASDIKIADTGNGYAVGEIPAQHPQFHYLNPGTLVCLFDGVDIALDYVTKNMPTARGDRSSSEPGGDGFHAFKSYKLTMDTFRNHPEDIVTFNPAELRIKDESEIGTSVEYNVTGDYIDMGRYVEGLPDSFGTMHRGYARNRRASIVINLSQTWHINHQAVTRRGERILRLVDALEAGGVRTQLTGIESSQCVHAEVIVKRHDEPLTIADLAVISHPEFLRRVLFRVIEYSKTYQDGYGSSVVFSQALTPEAIDSGNNEEMTIAIDGNLDNIDTIDDLFDKLEKLLVWEMSKPVPEVSSVMIKPAGIYFNPNGARAESEIRREGLEAINAVA